VHVWSYKTLLDTLPDYPWLVKHNPKELEQPLFNQLFWQATKLNHELESIGCDILFTTDASTFCRFKPMVVLSRDMLSYEPGVMRSFGFGIQRLRLLAILYLQNLAFRHAAGVIFLTHYAGEVIQKSCGALPRVAYIPHGIGEDFKQLSLINPWPIVRERPVRCLYVSNAAMYKHQWVVVSAIETLRKVGHDITLTLVGGGAGKAQRLLERQISISDPDGNFVQQFDFVPQKDLPAHLANADLFVFASSCENMPNTLVEAMAAGLPIACSNRGPMPEVLKDGGVYFDPENADSISNAVEQLITNKSLRERVARCAKTISEQYSWSRCANETWEFIFETYVKLLKMKNENIRD